MHRSRLVALYEYGSRKSFVLVVRGGSNVNLQVLDDYRVKYGKDENVVGKFHSRRLETQKQKLMTVNGVMSGNLSTFG